VKKDSSLTRRQFIQTTAAAGVSTLTIGFLLAGCKGDTGKSSDGEAKGGGGGGGEAKGCNDVSGLTEQEKATRTSLKYVEKSPEANKNCANCSLYQQPKAGEYCGGCSVMKGPINPKGYCTAWAPKG